MEKNDFDKVFCFINGIPHYIEKPEKLLINYLREDCKLAGTKLGCGEGGCGACTVWIWTVHPVSQQLDCYTINACLVTLAMVDACYIVTVEGIGSRKDELHPIQRLLVQHNGSQCGYCTPGILMSMFGFLEKNKFSKQVLDIEEIESCFDGNLCRCTGYRSIFDAFRSYVQAKETFCIKESISIPEDALQHIFLERRRKLRVWISQQQPHCNKSMYLSETTASPYNSFDRFPIFVRPTNLQETIYYKRLYPDAKFVVGNSEIGIDIKMKKRWNCFILLNDVQELLHIDDTKSNGWSIGAAVSLSKLLDRIQQLKENQFQFRTLYMLRNQLQRFAGTQIRNVACLGGNIATASPISDINPLLAATNAKLRWISCKHGTYSEANAKDFFVGYRSTLLKEDDLLVDVLIPLTKRNEYVFAYKVSRRVDDDIAIVSAGMRFTCSIISQQSPNDSMLVDTRMNKKIVLEDVSLVYGGMADRTKNAQQTEMVLCGSVLESCSLLSFCRNTLDKDFALKEDSPGGMIEFRRTLACSLLLRSFHRLERLLCNEQIQDSCDELDHSTFSSHATQIFQQLNDEGNGTCHLGRTVPHQSTILQCCGEAQYVDDIPSSSDTLYCAFILSSVPHANILSIDCSEAYNQCPGIKKIFLSQDVPGTNQFAIANNVEDEEVFCSGHVTAVGQIIGMVVADTREHALLGRRMVKVDYERLPAILTIEEARQQQSFEHCCGRKRKWWTFPPHFIEQGNVEEEFHRTDLLQIRGNVKIGAQEHFYLETHGCLAIPGENDELVIYVSTQSPSKTQMVIAHVLGLPSHKVVCKTKRIGGGFGGKETRNIFISCAVAVAAHTLKKPIRIYLDREDDMVMTGHRHPFFGDYRVAFDRLGKIHAVETLLFANIGNSLDLSMAVLDRALFHSENVYHIPNIRIVGRLCWTHTISNTAFRGFGGPQGMAIAETWIHHVASALMMNPETVRSLNMYGVGENSLTTPYGMKLLGYSGWECWQSVMESSDFWKRKQTVNEYNANHRYRKRGIAAVPTKFGISFTNKTYNQAGVLIHVYLDGSVLVSHGGVEMGQGLYTKIVQIVATELCIPLEKVYISETSTDKIPNASPTAASSSTDLYGMAAKDACLQLLERLKPLTIGSTTLSWEELIRKAYHERISLSASGFYRTPEIDSLDLAHNQKGSPFYYFTVGAAVSEIELDVLTGEHRIIRTDIVMDIGRPLNPNIDIGQIEGGFVQGLGLFTLEEVVYGDKEHPWLSKGTLFTRGPSNYKIPGFRDIPRDFRVTCLPQAINHRPIIHGSKAVGEPPLFLAFSVFEALRHAIESVQKDYSGVDAIPAFCALDSPLSVERIRMACWDDILSYVLGSSLTEFRPRMSC